MLSEMGKVMNKQMEVPTSSFERKAIEEGNGHLKERLHINDAPEKTMEISETSEVSLKDIEEGTRVLRPDMETIKTQSLEAVKQSNMERTQTSVTETPNSEFRKLAEEEMQKLREQTNLSETAIELIRVDAEGNYYLKCRNEELAGKNHEVTGVKYLEKAISVNGVEIIVVVPELSAVFECKISEELWNKGDSVVFKNSTEQLGNYLEAHPEMKEQFNSQQLEQIMNGEPYIKGYTWHHSEVPGKMQLVETKTHALSGHTGGNSIWCGGIH